MPYSQTFPNGQTLNSTALSAQQFTDVMQQATCNCLGMLANAPYSTVITIASNQIVVDDVSAISLYFKVSGTGIPAKTIVTAIDVGTNTLTLNNPATVNGAVVVLVSNPLAGRLVRQEWPSKGAPAWDKTDNIAFLRCVEIDDAYNKVRDQGQGDPTETGAVLITEFTRVWRVSWVVYGPIAYDRTTLLKSAMQQDFIHDSLAALNVFLMPEVSNPRRMPEEFEGEYWERSDFEMVFYEQVTETIVTNTVASVEVLVLDTDGIKLDLEIGA